MLKQMQALNEKIDKLGKRLHAYHKDSEQSQRLDTIPGVGPLTATAILATVGDISQFKTARQFSAWLGLTPMEHSSEGKTRLGRISKRGDTYIRQLLVHWARAVVRVNTVKYARPFPWLNQLLAHKPKNVATVALANKNARVVWALLTKHENYRPLIGIQVSA